MEFYLFAIITLIAAYAAIKVLELYESFIEYRAEQKIKRQHDKTWAQIKEAMGTIK